MVGASLKSRSAEENCWFSIRTTPRSRGEDFKTQNGKNKSEHIAFRNYRIYRRSRNGWREKISGRRRRRLTGIKSRSDYSGHLEGDTACE